MNSESNIGRLRTWRIALAAMLAIAGSQLAFAGHQFEHDLDSTDDVCAVCLQIERLDLPPCAVAAALLPAPEFESPQVAPATLGVSAAVSPYSTRAPPLL